MVASWASVSTTTNLSVGRRHPWSACQEVESARQTVGHDDALRSRRQRRRPACAGCCCRRPRPRPCSTLTLLGNWKTPRPCSASVTMPAVPTDTLELALRREDEQPVAVEYLGHVHASIVGESEGHRRPLHATGLERRAARPREASGRTRQHTSRRARRCGPCACDGRSRRCCRRAGSRPRRVERPVPSLPILRKNSPSSVEHIDRLARRESVT